MVSKDANPGKCVNCGADRVFECQLMSNLLNFSPNLAELDLGVAVVYSCSESCPHGKFFFKFFILLYSIS